MIMCRNSTSINFYLFYLFSIHFIWIYYIKHLFIIYFQYNFIKNYYIKHLFFYFFTFNIFLFEFITLNIYLFMHLL